MTQADEIHEILNLVVSADDDTRDALARRLAEDPKPHVLCALAATARSSEPLLLRSRCLEILSLIARDGDERAFRAVMAAVRPADEGSTKRAPGKEKGD